VTLREEQQSLLVKVLDAVFVLGNDCIMQIVQYLVVFLLEKTSFDVDPDQGDLVRLYNHGEDLEPKHAKEHYVKTLLPVGHYLEKYQFEVEIFTVRHSRKAYKYGRAHEKVDEDHSLPW